VRIIAEDSWFGAACRRFSLIDSASVAIVILALSGNASASDPFRPPALDRMAAERLLRAAGWQIDVWRAAGDPSDEISVQTDPVVTAGRICRTSVYPRVRFEKKTALAVSGEINFFLVLPDRVAPDRCKEFEIDRYVDTATALLPDSLVLLITETVPQLLRKPSDRWSFPSERLSESDVRSVWTRQLGEQVVYEVRLLQRSGPQRHGALVQFEIERKSSRLKVVATEAFTAPSTD
jgi:hypothetical protein